VTRRFTALTLALTGAVFLLVGLMLAGALTPASPVTIAAPSAARPSKPPGVPTLVVDFADIAARVNPAVVYIEAVSAPHRVQRGAVPRDDVHQGVPAQPDDQLEHADRDSGSGFLVTADGEILTNQHVVDGAERLNVKLADGRSLRARVIGADPDTDVALIKLDGVSGLPVAELGDSAALRPGEWVCAIGNPLAYEHTVTVGVVSYVGRKLFDESLDDYIQTDAAIDFGNSGGPLINTAGQVIGINSAISSEGNDFGFAVPINQAREILGQLRRRGRVVRGYIGVNLREIDADLQRSLRLGAARGVLVEDVNAGSPAERAGLKRYDVITAVDGRGIQGTAALIRNIASREPGSRVALHVVRDGRAQDVEVDLVERPLRDEPSTPAAPSPADQGQEGERGIGVSVQELTRQLRARWKLPAALSGVIVTRVAPLSPADEADLRHGDVIIEINRTAIRTVGDYRQVAAAAMPGDVLTFYVYDPASGQRALHTLRAERQP
jgi:Do/DeqQ family serine protease